MRFPFDKQFFPLLSTSFPNRSSKSQHQVKSSIFQLLTVLTICFFRKIETGKSFTFDSFHAVNGIHTAMSTITPITFSFVIFTLPSPCHITYIDFTIITNPSCYMIIAFGNKKSLPTSDKPFLSIQNISSKVAV